MEIQLADRWKKRWFVEGLWPKLKKKIKIVPPTSYIYSYNWAMDPESEQKMRKKKKDKSSDSDDSSSESNKSGKEPSKKVWSLQKNMLRMMKAFKNMKKNPGLVREGELWCTNCKEEGHTKGSCPKKTILRYLPNCGSFHQGMPIQYENKETSTIVHLRNRNKYEQWRNLRRVLKQQLTEMRR